MDEAEEEVAEHDHTDDLGHMLCDARETAIVKRRQRSSRSSNVC
jgi:hypothetical protein